MAELHTCKFCGTDFDPEKRTDDMQAKLFCSYSCHNKYYRKQRQAKKLAGLASPDATFMTDNGEHPVHDKPVSPLPVVKPLSMKELPSKASALSFGSFGPAEQFIIATLQDENNALKAVKEKLKDKVETLTKELADERQARREDVLKKPSTLEGLSESPVIAQLMPHIGPALGQLLNKLMGSGTSVGIPGSTSGMNGQQLPEETDKMVSALVGWFISLPVELQTMFFNMVRGLAEKSPEDQVKMLEQLSALVLNNSSFKQDYYAA